MRLIDISLLFGSATYLVVWRPVVFTSRKLCWMNRRMCLVIMTTIAGISPEPFFRIQKTLGIRSPIRMIHLFTYNCLSKREQPMSGQSCQDEQMKINNNLRVNKCLFIASMSWTVEMPFIFFLWLFSNEDHQVVTYIYVRSNGKKTGELCL